MLHEGPTTAQQDDALSDVLSHLQLTASTYFCSEFQAPWEMEIMKESRGAFHCVIAGGCWVTVAGRNVPIFLEEGDIVAFPTGCHHYMCDSLSLKSDSFKTPVLAKRPLTTQDPVGMEGQYSEASSTTLMCGHFAYDQQTSHPFLKDLPCFIHLRSVDLQNEVWVKQFVMAMAQEARSAQPGSKLILTRMTEVLFIQILRVYFQIQPQSSGYFSALLDPKIGKALNIIHQDEKSEWSVERLSDAIALSRSAFSEKFTALVGVSPKTYMTEQRMLQAKRQLRESLLSIAAIADGAGYSSEAAFHKAFKQFFGKTPGQVRKHS